MGQATLGAKTGSVEHETMTRRSLQMSNTPEVKVPRVDTNYKDLLLTTSASGGVGQRQIGCGELRWNSDNDSEGRCLL